MFINIEVDRLVCVNNRCVFDVMQSRIETMTPCFQGGVIVLPEALLIISVRERLSQALVLGTFGRFAHGSNGKIIF